MLTSCLFTPLFLQVIPKPGRTNLSPGTRTTWWAQTACLCSSTTSEESDSWSVTECETEEEEEEEGESNRHSPPLPSPTVAERKGGGGGVHGDMKDELDPVYCGRETEEQNIEEESRRSPSPSRGCAPPLPPVGVFSFFLVLR